MAKTVEEYEDFFTDPSASGVVINTTWGADIYLSQLHSFFELKEPALGNINSNSSYEDLTDRDSMGDAPDKGTSFGANLQGLLKTGHQHLPEIAANFSSKAEKGADEGLDEAFSRQSREYNDTAGEYTATSSGPFLPAWSSLYEAFNKMLSNTGKNLNAAAEGLIAAVDVYAAEDEAAAANLRKNSDLYDN